MFKGINFNINIVASLAFTVGLLGLTGFTAVSGTQETPAIDRRQYQSVETATFALGCFWSGDAMFGAVPGVIRTRVGYAGGTKEDPTYYNLGDHTESIQIDYNPEKVSFEQLAEIFWNNHNPRSRNFKIQYANILFYHNQQQKVIAQASKRELVAEGEGEIYTSIQKLNDFYPAEDYHQKYHLRRSGRFIKEIKSIYPDPDDLRDSTAAARLNGYLAGYGSPEEVRANIRKLGLSPKAQDKLLNRVEGK